MIKKGQLRRWKEYYADDGTFMVVGCRLVYGEDRRAELGWGGGDRGRRIWSLLQDGKIIEEDHGHLYRHSEVIE